LKLILASSSPFRKQILERLKWPFLQISPDIDESAKMDESAPNLVNRLAQEKGKVIAKSHPNAWVIASDQVAVCNGQILGKPMTYPKAFQQLKQQSGQKVIFYTSIALLNNSENSVNVKVVTTEVKFIQLTDQHIGHYLNLDKPFNCAGSFKSESLGIALFESISSEDSDALMGLPLMTLLKMMRKAGIEPLDRKELL